MLVLANTEKGRETYCEVRKMSDLIMSPLEIMTKGKRRTMLFVGKPCLTVEYLRRFMPKYCKVYSELDKALLDLSNV